MSGWISVTRKHALGKHDLFKNEPFTEREAWTWLVANAAWEDTTHRVSGQRVDVPRGSFIGTLREMMTEWGWGSDTRVRKFLAKLEGEDMIERTAVGQKNARKTHVTICNYDDYQSVENKKTSKKRTEERAKNAVKEQINNKQTTSNEVVAREILSEVVAEFQAQEFLDFRREMRKPVTPRSARAIVNKLVGHHDPWGVLNNSIANGWQGVFPETTRPAFTAINGGQHGKPTDDPRNDPTLRAIAAAATAF